MQEEVKEPVSMFVLFARMFSITAKNLEKEFGEKGLKALEDSVKEFGIERGKDIAARAKANPSRCGFALHNMPGCLRSAALPYNWSHQNP